MMRMQRRRASPLFIYIVAVEGAVLDGDHDAVDRVRGVGRPDSPGAVEAAGAHADRIDRRFGATSMRWILFIAAAAGIIWVAVASGYGPMMMRAA
jgi:hypothetical protein